MIQYTISCANRISQNIQIRLFFDTNGSQEIVLGLPAWRPGRYEFQHYARNIFNVKASGTNKNELNIVKIDRNTWCVATKSEERIEITYEYSCTQFDAGGCWIDDLLIYINPINCLFYLKDRQEEACGLSLNLGLEHGDNVASHLKFEKGYTSVENYFKLADSPFFISLQLEHEEYFEGDTSFHIWTHGEIAFNKKSLLNDFQKFSSVQIDGMGTFPEKEYHFLLLLLPFRHYHGVEHHQSTVITLGPTKDLSNLSLYEELISISSHELFHAWNICKIRPVEMYPYLLDRENYFRTGFVAEGITTYLGEYFLLQSGFFNEERFLLEIEQWLNRHAMHRGLERSSLSDSSFDLWVDGYVGSSADFKVSIYVAGALAAIALDLQIRLKHSNKSILNLMRSLYQDKALKNEGYSLEDFQRYVEDLIGEESANYWEQCISGQSVDSYLSQSLKEFGITVASKSSVKPHEKLLGIKLKPSSTKPEIAKVQLDSPAGKTLMVDDVIVAVNGYAVSDSETLDSRIEEDSLQQLSINRKGRLLEIALTPAYGDYWSSVEVKKNSAASDLQKLRYNDWMKRLV